jgi:hypothetical protein
VFTHGGPKPGIAVKDGETAAAPQQLPGGQILFALATGQGLDRWDRAQIVVQAPGSSDRKVVIDGGSDPRYLPTGHIVYSVAGSLMAMLDVRGSNARAHCRPRWRAASAAGASSARTLPVSDTGLAGMAAQPARVGP